MLGDLEQVSLEFQQGLGSDVFVGRLAFRDERGLSAYVDKVLRWERAPSAESRARSPFFTAHDGTAATRVGYQRLVLPSLQACRARQQRGELTADLQVRHGLGAPRRGWSSVREQQALQGAMSLGRGEHLRAEDVASRPFLPGGLWVYLACFGGGTPRTSPYFHWLRRLQDAGAHMGQPEAVLASLPRAGEPPFIAALPLARPRPVPSRPPCPTPRRCWDCPWGFPTAASTGPGVQTMEEAVVALMTGAESPKALAARAGVSLAEPRHWERTFREAGRAALAALTRSGGQG